jgi:hypothetical protein
MKSDNYLLAILGTSFLLFASFYNNPLSLTSGILIGAMVMLVAGLNNQLKKD